MTQTRSVRQELHTERHSRGERESLHSPQLHRERDAARQRAAATRRRETDEGQAERCVCHSLLLCVRLPPSRFDQRHTHEHSDCILTRRLGLPPLPHKQVAGEPTKRSYEAPAGDNTSERGEVCACIRPGMCLSVRVSVLRALVACKKSLVAKEFSQHRHRSFRLVIASSQI